MLDSFIRAGVPVLSLPIGSDSLYSFFDSGIEDESPALPPVETMSPVYIFPLRKVPVVKIVFAPFIVLVLVTTPFTKFFSIIISITSSSKTSMVVFFRIFCMAFL